MSQLPELYGIIYGITDYNIVLLSGAFKLNKHCHATTNSHVIVTKMRTVTVE